MTDAATLEQALREVANARVQAVRLGDGGAASVVVDAEGLDDAARATLEGDLNAAAARVGIAPLRVAMTASRRRRRIIAVGSGKGGVGKSTLAANLAIALHRLGRPTGLVDADIYGPSQARLFDTEDKRPEAKANKLIPVASRFGVPMLSMGHLVRPGQPIAWRGPMVSNALGQLIDAEWGAVETIVVDLPPGTGDVQLTMLQKYKPAGAVIVSTPQDLALIDATRAIALFEQGTVPLIGMVENMAGYLCPHCGEPSDPFGNGGAEAAAKAMNLPFLGRIPLALGIREGSDAGQPPAAGEGPLAEAYRTIARRIADWLDRNP
ncbi:Mrp/NBP35 family ATP-binding protein [Novosphingobium sp. Fuku2-ISO-50]|jgi:ATP-binding protein involved in chromosome partitioning|uniref:Mrp/NBP35 family ATP-binding protein n=1 Tax=Novosphingobium sp. Fuku2-ISO-50 TaxID=1739114 RepID=UPI00076C5A34|nr:Mrp/NBP35 family ATP-binding protein [Novosphingobium sp. Fuku2-ISO-50]KUR74747.1 chromosome partitioning protein ParA [Novosphingobium sp. Fuku2-ISO-50]